MANGVTLQSNVDAVNKKIDQAFAQAAEIIGSMAESHAKQYLTDSGAVDTGRLRNSVAHGVSGGKLSITEYTDNSGKVVGTYGSASVPKDANYKYIIMIGSNVFYAPFIELGTTRMAARPYLRPAIEQHKDEYKNVLKTLLNQ